MQKSLRLASAVVALSLLLMSFQGAVAAPTDRPGPPNRTDQPAAREAPLTASGNVLLWQEYVAGEVTSAPAPGDPFDLTNPTVAWSAFQMPGNAALFTGAIVETTAQDMDIFVGRDANGNGKPDVAELECAGASAAALDSCTIEHATAGAYWVLLHNYAGTNAKDSYAVSLDVVGPIIQITSSAPASAGAVLHPGDTVEFTIGIQPVLPAAEEFEFILNNTLPQGLRYVTGSGVPAPLAVVGNQLTWVAHTSGDYVAIRYMALVEDDAPVNTLITNTVAYTVQPGGGPVPETVSTDIIISTVNLAITATAPTQVSTGSTVLYTLTVANSGTGPANDVVVAALLPPGSEHVTGGELFGDLVIFEAPEVPAGSSVAVAFEVRRSSTPDPVYTAPGEPAVPATSRIVGGEPAQPSEIPWQVALWDMEFDSWWGCGGSVIAPEWVLTAAHCVTEFTGGVLSADLIGASVGRHLIQGDEGTTIAASEVVVNQGFDYATYSNDIALLRLEQPVVFSDTVLPIALADSSNSALYSAGTPSLVSGWGSRQYDAPDFPDELYKVTVPVVDRATCDQNYQDNASYPPGSIDETMVCAGLPEGGKDSCYGDDGGPMAAQTADGRWVQIGIVSWGQGCAAPGLPGVYSNVAALLPWVFQAQNTLTLYDYVAFDEVILAGHSAVGEESVSTLVMDQGYLPVITK